MGYPVAEPVNEKSILRVCYVPARGISQEIQDRARRLAEQAVSLFPRKGVVGVRMFLMDDGSNPPFLPLQSINFLFWANR